jgi:hypothetical protein
MTLRCPACNKTNDVAAETACPRCGCDLSMLSSILWSTVQHLKAASAQFRARDWEAALWHAERSWSLRHTPAAAQLACLAAAALGDSVRVGQWLRHARRTEE